MSGLDVDDFLWRCTICGATGRGAKSEAAYLNQSGSHGLKNIERYVPELRYEAAMVRLGEAKETIAEKVPDDDAFVLSEVELRTVIAVAVHGCYDESFEERAACGNEHGQTLDHITRLVWNDYWWDGFHPKLVETVENERRRREQ